MRTYVLLDEPLSGDANRDATAIVSALAKGRAYIGVDGLAPAHGFFAVVERDEQLWSMGDTVPYADDLTLRSGGLLPPTARLRLLRDGVTIAEAEGALQLDDVAPGVYRVEVRLPDWEMPWIVSNPLYVFDEGRASARATQASWPDEPPPPTVAAMLDLFEDDSILAPEFDPSSSVTFDIVPSEHPERGGWAGRMRFRLGTPTVEQPDTWCALVSREPRDLAGKRGLTFAIRSDGDYRLWAQVRDENPGSSPDGTEAWSDSVRSSRKWRRVTVPFADMRSPNEHTDGRLDLDKVRMLVLTVDPGSVKPGTTGTIWIDDFAVY